MKGSRRRRQLRWLLCSIIVGALVGVGAGELLIRYANPQWHKWIYLAQSGIDLQYPERARPDDYTGTWKRWFPDGSSSETEFRNGKGTGKCIVRNADGRIEDQWEPVELADGTPGVVWRHWHRNGQLAFISHWVNGEPHGPDTRWDPDGNLISDGSWKNARQWQGTFLDSDLEVGYVIATYENGTLVKREPFRGAVR